MVTADAEGEGSRARGQGVDGRGVVSGNAVAI